MELKVEDVHKQNVARHYGPHPCHYDFNGVRLVHIPTGISVTEKKYSVEWMNDQNARFRLGKLVARAKVKYHA